MSVKRKKGKSEQNLEDGISVLFINLNLGFILKLHIVYEYCCWWKLSHLEESVVTWRSYMKYFGVMHVICPSFIMSVNLLN